MKIEISCSKLYSEKLFKIERGRRDWLLREFAAPGKLIKFSGEMIYIAGVYDPSKQCPYDLIDNVRQTILCVVLGAIETGAGAGWVDSWKVLMPDGTIRYILNKSGLILEGVS